MAGGRENKVTVGLAVYNGADYLEEAMESLVAQTFGDMCILVSDNASTDATPQILEKWAKIDPRIRLHRQKENVGATANFEWLLHNATSDLFMWAAHDDKWSPDYVARLYAALRKNPKARLSVGTMQCFHDDGSEDRPKSVDCSSVSAVLRTMHSGGMQGLLYREDTIRAYEKMKQFPGVWGLDMLFILSFVLAGQVACDNDAVFYKRITPLSEGRYRPKTAAGRWENYRYFWKEMLAYCPKGQRLRLLPGLFAYARWVGKPKQILKMWVKEKLGLKPRAA
jgi:glycosyltransferase involved in cell wall biosynthesis